MDAGAILSPAVEVAHSPGGLRATVTAKKFALANFAGATNVVYRAEAASNAVGPWTEVPFVDGGSDLRVQTDGSETRRFFRIKMLRP